MAEGVLELVLRIKKSGTGAKEAEKELSGLQGTVVSLGGAMNALAGSAAVGALVAGLKFSIDAAMEAEQVMAATENAIRATGGAAGLTAKDISSLAGSLSAMSGVEDETIQSGENLLLTFKEIKGETFERATASMLDMAVAMNQGSLEGIDLKSTALQLGKALNVAEGDTAAASKAMGALSRAGVSFTTAQRDAAKAAIEMGDVAAYQAIVLGELESEFGGAGEAAGNTAAGGLAKLHVALGNLGEAIGEIVLPPLMEFIGTLKDGVEVLTFLLNWNKNMDAAFAEHSAALLTTSATYTDYVAEMTSAYVRAGELTESQRDMALAMDGSNQVLQILIDKGSLASESEFNLAQMTNGATEEMRFKIETANILAEAESNLILTDEQLRDMQVQLKDTLGELHTLINGRLGPEYDSFAEKHQGLIDKGTELKSKIDELEGKQWLTEAQKQELATARTELALNNEAFKKNADEHDLATKRIIFGLLEQRVQSAITSGQISGPDAEKLQTALINTATNFGLIDQATATAMAGVNEAVGGLLNGGSLDQFDEKMVTLATTTAQGVTTANDGLATSFTATGDEIEDQFLASIKNTNTELKTKVPEAAATAKDGVAGFGTTLNQQTKPGDVIERYLIGLSKVEAAYRNIASAARDVPGLPSAAPAGSQLSGVRADGGPVEAGHMYLVGEEGPEPFIAPRDGFILPNSSLDAPTSATSSFGGGGFGGGNVTNIYVTIPVGPLTVLDRVKLETEVAPVLKEVLGL